MCRMNPRHYCAEHSVRGGRIQLAACVANQKLRIGCSLACDSPRDISAVRSAHWCSSEKLWRHPVFPNINAIESQPNPSNLGLRNWSNPCPPKIVFANRGICELKTVELGIAVASDKLVTSLAPFNAKLPGQKPVLTCGIKYPFRLGCPAICFGYRVVKLSKDLVCSAGLP